MTDKEKLSYLTNVLRQVNEVTSLGGGDNINSLNTTIGWVDGMVTAALLVIEK